MQARGDRDLIEASRRGDRAAFAEVIARYQRAVYAVAFSGVRDRALADDVTQDAFVIAWRKLDELRDATRLPAWLCGIARNVARDARKRRRFEVADDAPDATDTTTPYDAMTDAESERIVAAALGQVPDVYREPLVLYYYEERSIEEVARSLGITAATTNKRLSRGRQFLAERVATIVDRGVTRRGPSPALVASVLALVGITLPASHVDASPVSKGSTMHKLALAATIAATVTTTGIVVATTTRSGDARASSGAGTGQTVPFEGPSDPAHHAGLACLHGSGPAPALPAILRAPHHRDRAKPEAVEPATDCATIGRHLADLEASTGHGGDERCATDYTSLCETEGWSAERRACVLAADDLINAHLCASAAGAASHDDIPPSLACPVIAAHITPIIQGAGAYADVPDFAQQVESACDDGSWSLALRQCFAAAQGVDELHGCINP
jgi:RNA polymerase sigma factor (sigma-70 family)